MLCLRGCTPGEPAGTSRPRPPLQHPQATRRGIVGKPDNQWDNSGESPAPEARKGLITFAAPLYPSQTKIT